MSPLPLLSPPPYPGPVACFPWARLVKPHSVRHMHIVERVSEAKVSKVKSDGSVAAVRSVVQWKEKPDHVFTACDDGFVKVRGHRFRPPPLCCSLKYVSTKPRMLGAACLRTGTGGFECGE